MTRLDHGAAGNLPTTCALVEVRRHHEPRCLTKGSVQIEPPLTEPLNATTGGGLARSCDPLVEFVDEVTSKETRERHWRWLLAYLVLTAASALVGGIVVSGWWLVGTSLAFSLVIFFVNLRAIMKRTIETHRPGERMTP
jgi:hypothetical protein